MEYKKQVEAIQELVEQKEKLNKLIDFHKEEMTKAEERKQTLDWDINKKLIDLKYS